MSFNRFARMFARNAAPQAIRKNRQKSMPILESLDRRDLMAASVLLSGTTLNVYGTDDIDRVQVESYTITGPSTSGIALNIPMVRATVKDAANTIVAQNSYVSWSIGNISIATYAGEDHISQPLNYATSVWSGLDTDFISTGDGADYIVADTGDDLIGVGNGDNTVYGGLGNDTIFTVAGNDYVSASDGNDYVSTGTGNDSIWGGTGNDRIYAGSGNDQIDGGNNDDMLYGQEGLDSIWGALGNDEIDGGADADQLMGNEGNDKIYGSTGNDTIWGSSGNDVLYADEGNDTLYGGTGNDSLYAAAGADKLYGDEDNDLLVAIDGSYDDSLYGGAGTDNFWYDYFSGGGGIISEITDASAAESSAGWVHNVRSFANGADKTLNGDNITDPTDSGTKANFASSPLFPTAGPGTQDIDQGNVGDCWLMSGLGEAAKSNQNSIFRTVVPFGDGTFGVKLGSNYYRVDADLPVNAAGTPVYAGSAVDDSIWVSVIEKAYTHYRTGANTYASLASGWSTELWNAIGASSTAKISYASGSEAAAGTYISNRMAAGNAVVVSINNAPAGSGLVSQHVYMVDAVDTVLQRITLRNPWGTAGSGANNNTITVALSSITAGMYGSNNGIMSAAFPA